MKGVKLLLIIFLAMSISFINAQDNSDKLKKQPPKPKVQKFKKAWNIGLYGGYPMVFGDVNSEVTYKNLGYGLSIEKALSNSLSLKVSGGMGTAYGIDKKYATADIVKKNPALNGSNNPSVNYNVANLGYQPYMNYKMEYKEANMYLLYNFNINDFRGTEYHKYRFFVLIGGGAFIFNTFTDQYDNSTNAQYDYSTIYNDYTAGNITQAEAKDQVAGMLDRNYETPAMGNPDGNGFLETEMLGGSFIPTVSGGIGVRFKLSKRLELLVETKGYYTENDKLDGRIFSRVDDGESPNNDVFTFTNIGINIKLGRQDNINWYDNPDAMHYKVTLDNKRKIALLSSDIDGDGVSDYFDKDLETPEGVRVDPNGVPIDSDEDGVPDYLDEQPFSDKGAVVDSLGVPLDTDKDGVPDHKDLDNETPEGKLVNFQGIEIGDKGSATGMSGSALGFLPVIFFDFNDARLKTEAFTPLTSVAAALKYNPNMKLKVVGYTDDIGDPNYNIQLGKRRAQAVVDFLVMQGVSADKLIIESRGEAEPLTDVKSSDAKRLNRRVQFEPIEGGQVEPVEEEETE